MHVFAAADAERTNVFGELIDFRLSHLNLTPLLGPLSLPQRSFDMRQESG